MPASVISPESVMHFRGSRLPVSASGGRSDNVEAGKSRHTSLDAPQIPGATGADQPRPGARRRAYLLSLRLVPVVPFVLISRQLGLRECWHTTGAHPFRGGFGRPGDSDGTGNRVNPRKARDDTVRDQGTGAGRNRTTDRAQAAARPRIAAVVLASFRKRRIARTAPLTFRPDILDQPVPAWRWRGYSSPRPSR